MQRVWFHYVSAAILFFFLLLFGSVHPASFAHLCLRWNRYPTVFVYGDLIRCRARPVRFHGARRGDVFWVSRHRPHQIDPCFCFICLLLLFFLRRGGSMRRGCLVILPRVRASFMEQRLEQPSSYYYGYSRGTAAL